MAADMKSMFLETLRPQIEQANNLVSKIIAASGDQTTLVHDIRDNPETTDERVKKFQEWLRKIDEQREKNIAEIDEHIRQNLLPAKDETFDVEKAKTEYAEMKKNINAGKAYAKTPAVGLTDEDFAALPEVKNLRGGSTGGGNTAGTKRPRVTSIKVNGENVVGKKKEEDGSTSDVVNFTVLGTYLTKEAGVTVKGSDIREEVEKAANTEDLSDVKGQTFNVSHTVNGKTFEIEVLV